MSLFDVIRWPLSNPPFDREILALPREMQDKWHRMNLSNLNTHRDLLVCGWTEEEALNVYMQGRDNIILSLREMILNYDNLPPT